MTHEKIVTDRAIGAATPEELETPTLRQQTQTLGETLKHIADNDPAGTPTEQAIAVFHEWLEAAGATSERSTSHACTGSRLPFAFTASSA